MGMITIRFPTLKMNDSAYLVLPNSKLLTYLCLGNSTARRKFANLFDLFQSQFCAPIFFSFRRSECPRTWISQTSLFGSILCVIFRSSKKQVLWIAAKSYIAMMANAQSFWNWTVSKLIGYAVSTCVAASQFVFSVAGFLLNAAVPKPAIIRRRDCNPLPESLAVRWLFVPFCFGTKRTPFYSVFE